MIKQIAVAIALVSTGAIAQDARNASRHSMSSFPESLNQEVSVNALKLLTNVYQLCAMIEGSIDMSPAQLEQAKKATWACVDNRMRDLGAIDE